MEEQAEILISPLGEEEIETQSILDGKRMKHVVQMGPRVREFEQKIIKESAKLADAWKQWEALQDEFVALGSEVFGVEAFPSDAKGKTQQGYRKQMELIVLEHDTRVGEINEEIETVSREALQKMKASEKVGSCCVFLGDISLHYSGSGGCSKSRTEEATRGDVCRMIQSSICGVAKTFMVN